MELLDKTFNFEDNIGLLVLKMIIWTKRYPACKGIIQIWPLEIELWDRILNFEDNIGLK